MKFLEKIILKQNVKTYIYSINLIYEKAQDCLDPLVTIVFNNPAYKLNENDLKNLTLSLTTLSLYLNQLQTSSKELESAMNSHPEILKRFKKNAKAALAKIPSLHRDISNWGSEIRKVTSYDDSHELKVCLSYITRLENEIKAMNGVHVDIVDPYLATLN